jgi:hypothetical protein
VADEPQQGAERAVLPSIDTETATGAEPSGAHQRSSSTALDPRSEAEKARADLARNAELGMAVPESPLEHGPSVTPRTFGDTSTAGRVQSADQGVEAGGVRPKSGDVSETSPAAAEQVDAGRDSPEPVRPDEDSDALSRGKNPDA